ncbi:hypothetical protein EDD11_007907 [Mortierella claussenii]|nr:hypothetical protein EDD11_007907 [Mortierella claussenii]
MQSDHHAYQLPVSNIAYHVYNPEEDVSRTQAVSQQAFKRTMDNYHEHEHLADLFQVELDKRARLVQERKDRENMLKLQKKSPKRSHQGRSQDRSQPQSLPERHSLRRHLRNSSNSNNSIVEGGSRSSRDMSVMAKSTGTLKRSRRNSDISTSDVSGYGDDDRRILPPLPKSTHLLSSSSSSRHGGRGAYFNDQRSLSSTPALPLTPSPRLTPSDSRNENQMEAESGFGLTHRTPNQSASNSSASLATSASPSASFSTGPIPPLPGQSIMGRRKRKQAIPVHPSVVDRIPGITLRIQRESQGDQLQVEILKNVEDYKTRSENGFSTVSKLQATQDLRKVKESIESGRPGYAFFPAPLSATPRLHHLDSPEVDRSKLISGTSSIRRWRTDTDNARGFGLHAHTSFSTSTVSLTWSASNGGSVDSLAMMADMFEARSLPLSWENFSTRECVVNKLVGKHDQDLDALEEVVQDAIARQHYTHQSTIQPSQEHERDRDHTPAPATTQIQRRSSAGVSSPNSTSAAASVSHKSSKSTGTVSLIAARPVPARSVPARATRSRTHVSEQNGSGNLVAHEDIELVLKQKRKKKLEERRRQGSKASSKDDEDEDDERRTLPDDDDDDDDDDYNDRYVDEKRTSHREMQQVTSEMELDMGQAHESSEKEDEQKEDRGRVKAHGDHRKDEQEDTDGDVPMSKPSRLQRRRQISMENDATPVEMAQGQISSTRELSRTRSTPLRKNHRTEEYIYEGMTSSSEDDEDVEDEDDDEYQDRSHNKLPPTAVVSRTDRTLSQSKLTFPPLSKQMSESKAIHASSPKKATDFKSTVASSTNTAVPQLLKRRDSLEKAQNNQQQRISQPMPISSGGGIRRNKKFWSRGRNTRKEDEVVDTTSDDEVSASDTEDTTGATHALRTKHIQTSQPIRTTGSLPIKNGSLTSKPLPIATVSASTSTSVNISNNPSAAQHHTNDNSSGGDNGRQSTSSQKSGGRTRARARSFSSIIETADKTKFFESALDVIEQKRREALAKKKAARAEIEDRERQDRLERERREQEAEKRQESLARMQQHGKAQKIESTNLPKSSKSLPGRVLRRTKADGATEQGSVDPDCTSCRLELSAEDKALWKLAQESGEIRLPKTWGTHAILCTTCRLQYLKHHYRCTACFYVPVKEEMTASGSSCSRCKAGTWLMEAVRPIPIPEKRAARRNTVSDLSI